MNIRSLERLEWLAFGNWFVYIRPYSLDGQIRWRVTVERTAPSLVYVVSEDEDLDVAVATAYREVRKKLGIKRKRRSRERKSN